MGKIALFVNFQVSWQAPLQPMLSAEARFLWLDLIPPVELKPFYLERTRKYAA